MQRGIQIQDSNSSSWLELGEQFWLSHPTFMVASPTSNHQGFANLPRRLELPTFGGIDPNGWIARVEQFFELQNTAENQKIPLAMICMEGSALHWMRWLPQTNRSMRWPMLMMELIKRYDGRHSGNELERLCSVRQTSSVDEYIDEFVELVIPGLSTANYLGYFMHGLQSDIRVLLRVHNPCTLTKAMETARLVGTELQIISLRPNSRYPTPHTVAKHSAAPYKSPSNGTLLDNRFPH